MFIPTYLFVCFIALTPQTQWEYVFDAVSPTAQSMSAWSGSSSVSITKDRRAYMGPFGNDSLQLRLESIPQHDSLVIEMAVYILGSWDGVADDDRLTIILDSRDTLLCSTFSNTAYKQSYPSPRSEALNPRRSGSFETDVTGWVFTEPKIFDGPLDACYHLKFTLPHRTNTLSLSLRAALKDVRPIPANEAWGLGAVRIQTVRVFHAPKDQGPIVVPGR
ncbi:MAG: hypothetical protein NTX15_08640 [Candidatus Kapabacteria bacterium]|nr:hypothetical protein [Candidatus Kapabacteria bacterium]